MESVSHGRQEGGDGDRGDEDEDEDEEGKRRHPCAGCMSEDSTDQESPPTRRTFKKNPAFWRDQRITLALHWLSDRAPSTRPVVARGNTMRKRITNDQSRPPSLPSREGKGCVRGAPKGLPRNFYDREFWDQLSHNEKKRLNPQPAFHWDLYNIFR